MLKCIECLELKPNSDFYKSRNNKNNKSKHCKKCFRIKYNEKHHIPRPGLIYIISNPAWPGYFKVGQTVRNVEKRLNDYNCGCPLRDYKVEFQTHVEDTYLVEQLVHKKFNAHHEWCKAELSEIIAFLCASSPVS